MMLRLLILIALLWPVSSWGAAVHDGEANQSAAVTAATTLTITNKTTAGSNRCGIVKVAINSESPAITGVTWNGVAMTLIDTSTETASASLRASMWRIVNPPTGASSIVVSFDSAATGYAIAESYNGVDQTTPISNSNKVNTTASTASPMTLTVTTASDETVVDVVSFTQFDTVSPTVGAGQTSTLNQLYASFYFALASRQLGSVDGVMSWTFASGTGSWAMVGASLKAAGGGGGATPRTLSLLRVGQ